MTELSPEALNSLSREELIALIVQLFAELLGAPVLPYLSAQKAQAVTNFSFNVK